MKIFNESTLNFAKKSEKTLKQILAEEVSLEVRRSRFRWQSYTYPIHVVVFENNQHWGWFDPHTYQIGLNKKLITQAKEAVIKDILRHELAHYLTYIRTDFIDHAHGKEFQKTCQDFGWSQLVSKASLNIADQELYYEVEKKDKLMAKVKRLLKLAESDNQHEAELATLKANQLLLKYNLEMEPTVDWTLYSHTVLKGARRSAKLAAIYDILKHFLVAPVFIYGKNEVQLEVTGTKENIELADYIAHFLDQKLERLWKAQTELKGLRAKNSFFLGVAKGFESKMESTPLSSHESKQLIIIKEDLQEKMSLIHRRLSSSSQSGSRNLAAFMKGTESGKNLNINKAMKNKSTQLLNWRKS